MWLAPFWFEGPQQSTNERVIFLTVDRLAEIATIANRGNDSVNLDGWKLRSLIGNQNYEFKNIIIPAGKIIRVLSGKNATKDSPTDYVWTKKYIWNNQKDPATLDDDSGEIIAEFGHN